MGGELEQVRSSNFRRPQSDFFFASVLDDNKLLTLPNGERLNLPPNVRIMFKVEHLRYATLATVSRCGMIWFSEDVMSCRWYTITTLPRSFPYLWTPIYPDPGSLNSPAILCR